MFSSDNLPLTFADKTLALTYDDGPGPQTLEIAEFLHDQGLRATFFVVGKHVRQNRDIVSEVKKLGHSIANHTDTHQTLPTLVRDPDQLTGAVMEADRETQAFIGGGPFLLRAPGEAWDSSVADVLKQNEDLHKYRGPIK